jgi:hypothetical protein
MQLSNGFGCASFCLNLGRTTHANSAIRYDDYSSGGIIKINAIDSRRCQGKIIVQALLARSQQKHASVTPGRITANITELLVSRNNPPSLLLDAPPQNIIRQSAPALIGHRYRVVAATNQQLCDFVGEVLIDLKPSWHLLGVNVDWHRLGLSGDT